MKRILITSAISMIVFTLALGIVYPLVITGISQLAFPGNANGQQIREGGRLVGSKIIGQQFTDVVLKPDAKPEMDSAGNPVTVPDKRYFQTRPSGTTPEDNSAATTFANLGPNDLATKQAIVTNMDAYLALERPYDPGLTASQVPVDAVDTSASGIDPDISPANADIQAHRVAAMRHLTLATVKALIDQNTAGRGLGFSGEPSVDVVTLNLALDARR
ncbi:MAG: potassium-transporting ATPase subunit C [Solirubrobacterales bacterium]|nr:potassium-transporting ATPase subunit C [Solirubrobacterales bacterium]